MSNKKFQRLLDSQNNVVFEEKVTTSEKAQEASYSVT
jgi:hypothetical protein